jgi:hypothetical protein
MRVDPRLDEVVNGERGMLKGIQVCLDRECLVSAVTLMFSAVDALAALTRPVELTSTNGRVFQDWVDRFIKPEDSVGCSATDLWGARCGVLHLYSADSDLALERKAKRLVYQWKAGPLADADTPLPEDAIVITVELLHRALKDAVHNFIVASEEDPTIKETVAHHLLAMLCYEPFPVLSAIVEA